MRSCCGLASTSRGGPASTTTPSSMKTTRVADLAREAHLVGDDDHRHAVAGEAAHHVEHLADQLGVERRGRLVEEHQLRLHRQRAGDRDALLLAAGELRRVGVDLVARGRPGRAAPAPRSTRLGARPRPCTRIGASMTFSSAVMCGNRLKRWKTMPISARLRATSRSRSSCSLSPCCAVADQLAVDPEPAGVDLLEVVDAAQEGRLARARRARAGTSPRPAATSSVDALQHLERGRSACARPRR